MCFLWSPLNWDLPTPLPQFSLKLPFLHKLLKFKFLPRDTLLNIYSYHNELSLLAYIAWFHQIKVTMQCDLIVSLGGSKCSWGGTLAPWGGWSDSVFNHDGPAPPFLLSLGWTLIVLIAPHTYCSLHLRLIINASRGQWNEDMKDSKIHIKDIASSRWTLLVLIAPDTHTVLACLHLRLIVNASPGQRYWKFTLGEACNQVRHKHED